MKTCAYCGTEVNDKYCSFCNMLLTERYILEDGQRLDTSIPHFPEMQGIFKSTAELIQLETLELLCLLRHAREYRSDAYKLRILTHQAKSQGGNMEGIENSSYDEYEKATRKVWVIENIIKDRIGYFPQKVTEKFLAMYLERIEKSTQKRMHIRKSGPLQKADKTAF